VVDSTGPPSGEARCAQCGYVRAGGAQPGWRCWRCGHVNGEAAAAPAGETPPPVPAPAATPSRVAPVVPSLPAPAHVTVNRGRDELVITCRWLDARYLLLSFGLAAAALGGGAIGAHGGLLIFAVAFGAVMSYVGLVGLVNATVIRVTRDRLSVRHGPLPLPFRDLLVVERFMPRPEQGDASVAISQIRAIGRREYEETVIREEGVSDSPYATWRQISKEPRSYVIADVAGSGPLALTPSAGRGWARDHYIGWQLEAWLRQFAPSTYQGGLLPNPGTVTALGGGARA
jgi:hypothetical protein